MTSENLTTDQLDAIVLRIQKLLALSKSSNEHEAGLAAAKAQELLFRYNLEMSSVEAMASGGSIAYTRQHVKLGEGKAVEWQRDLVFTLARNNFCKAFSYSGSKSMAIVGQKHNYEAVMGMFDYLSATLKRLVERAFTKYRLAGGDDHHQTYKTSWLLGAVTGIAQQLREQRSASANADAQSSALVVVKDAELNQAVDDLIGKTGKHKASGPRSASGFISGVQAGRKVGLHRQVSASGKTAGALN